MYIGHQFSKQFTLSGTQSRTDFRSGPIEHILGDPVVASRDDRMFLVKVYNKNRKNPWALTLTEPVPEAFKFPALLERIFMFMLVMFILRKPFAWNLWLIPVDVVKNCSVTAVISHMHPSTSFFYVSKLKFRSIKCFHDNSPALLAAVEFAMETFD